LNVDDNLGFAQLFGEALVLLVQLLNFFLDGIAFGLRPPLLWSQGLADAGGALAPPGRQQRRIQSFAAEQCSDAAGTFGLAGFRQDAVFVLGSEAAALGLGHDFRVGVGGAGVGVRGTPVAFATLRLPPSHGRQRRRQRSGNLIVVHQEILSRPAL
jgi:hypothetical protein